MSSRPSIAIVGAGMGGLATAAALHRRGIGVTVYEQARGFARLGAGIQIGCNAMQVLRGLGLERRMRQEAFCPRSWNNRDAGTGVVRYDQIFGASAEQKYGAPYLLAHRGDLHAALASAVRPAASGSAITSPGSMRTARRPCSGSPVAAARGTTRWWRRTGSTPCSGSCCSARAR